MCLGSILLHGVGRVVFGSSDSYGGASSVMSHLPPFFHERFEHTEWLGPIMPAECDPLHERLLALRKAEEGRSRMKMPEFSLEATGLGYDQTAGAPVIRGTSANAA